jgi:regulator of sigma E protease
MITILLFILILAILILVHEAGHFFAAKMFGIKVEEFGLGFPPKLFAKTFGETTYTLNALPFGGFVKIVGENGDVDAASPDVTRSFAHAAKWKQAIVLVAGVTMNIIFAYALISLGFMIGLPASSGTSAFGHVQNTQLVITSVLPGSPADSAGLISGDVIIGASAGQDILHSITPDTVSELVAKAQSPVTIDYEGGDQKPRVALIQPNNTVIPGRQAIGVSMDMIGILKLSVPQALLQGFITTGNLLQGIIIGLWQFATGLIHPASDLSQVTGPVGIAKVVGEARSFGLVYVLSIVVLISLNLAVINLVPFPALDGGRLLFVGIEAVTRKKINAKFAAWVNGVGFAILLVLMVVITAHDIFNLF